jgi:hypothetical protein
MVPMGSGRNKAGGQGRDRKKVSMSTIARNASNEVWRESRRTWVEKGADLTMDA